LKNGGGQPDGQTRESSQPQRTDELDEAFVDAVATRLAEKLGEDDEIGDG